MATDLSFVYFVIYKINTILHNLDHLILQYNNMDCIIFLKGIVSHDWGGLQIFSLYIVDTKFEVFQIRFIFYFKIFFRESFF
jgi:hypothetical protein